MLRRTYDESRRRGRARPNSRAALTTLVAAAIALIAGVGACGRGRDANQSASDGGAADKSRATPARVVPDTSTIAYDDSSAEFPHVHFGDGQLSLNDRCIVRQAKLNRRMPPIYVNGQPIGFC